MAAPAPLAYRSLPPSSLSSNASSSSSTSPASKKQQDVAAGRRRWEEFKNKKKAEKTKKPSVQAQSDGAGKVVDDENQCLSLPSDSTSAVSSKSAASNGHVTNDIRGDSTSLVSGRGSTSSVVARVPVSEKQDGKVSSDGEFQRFGMENVRGDFDSKFSTSGLTSSDGSTITGFSRNASDQSVSRLPGTTAHEKTEKVAGSQTVVQSYSANLDGVNRNRLAPPLGAGGPLVVPRPISAAPISTSGYGEVEPTQNSLGKRLSPFGQPLPSTQGFQKSSVPLNPRLNSGTLVKLDSKLFSNRGVRKEGLPPTSIEPEQELIPSGGPTISSASVSGSEWMRIDRQADGITSSAGTVGLLPPSIPSSVRFNPVVEPEWVSGAVNSFRNSLPPLSGVKPSSKISESSALPNFTFPEAAVPKYLPLPPPLARPPLFSSSTHSSKPVPFLPTSLDNAFQSSYSAGTLPTDLSTGAKFSENVSSGPIYSSTVNHHTPSQTTSNHYSNANAGAMGDSSSLLSTTSSTPAVEFPSQSKTVAESVGQSHQQWPPASSGVDDFAMLEQHIEDLTQEKFSLQRGLDAARALAETLAQENSSLTEDYNNQGALVNELRVDIERLQGELRAQAATVKNMKTEKEKALQESGAAIGRAQTLAAEVIGLEEKVLRSRSQELKLQREMETIAADADSLKRRISSLEKDRANLRSLVEALQEEKSLLQTRFRKAVSGSSGEVLLATSDVPSTSGSNAHSKIDAATSTEDLELGAFLTPGSGPTAVLPQSSDLPMQQVEIVYQQHEQPAMMPSIPSMTYPSPSNTAQVAGSISSHFMSSPMSQQTVGRLVPQNHSVPVATSFGGLGLNLGPATSVIPPDQVAVVENINILITELAEEKEALLKALRAESVGAAELRALNSELSQKLEVQTQRLELAVAQSMAHGSTPMVESTYGVSRMGPVYVDEGDEVVDRVLGWIMQLFPSGSSRRKRL